MPSKKSKKVRVPRLRACNGRACADFKGKRIYYGPANATEAEEAYRRDVAIYVANNGTFPHSGEGTTIVELILAYWRDRMRYFQKPDGTHTSSLERIRQALRPLRDMYAHAPADDFGTVDLLAIRQGWIDKGLSRKTVNDYTSALKHLFKWGAARDLVRPTVYQTLATIEGLRVGRSEAKESERRRPVQQDHVDAIEPYVSRQVWAMIQLQLLSGARPGEIVKLRPIDLNTEGEVWSALIQEHKTAYKGKKRVLIFGPQAQGVLRPFLLDRAVDEYMFSPKEAEKERAEFAQTHRRRGQRPKPRRTDRTLGEHYSVGSYRQAVKRGCQKAGIACWTPHRLRHTAATTFRQKYGLETTAAFLGHAELSVTQIYAESDQEKIIEAIKSFG